jgi:hypothetical protein
MEEAFSRQLSAFRLSVCWIQPEEAQEAQPME